MKAWEGLPSAEEAGRLQEIRINKALKRKLEKQAAADAAEQRALAADEGPGTSAAAGASAGSSAGALAGLRQGLPGIPGLPALTAGGAVGVANGAGASGSRRAAAGAGDGAGGDDEDLEVLAEKSLDEVLQVRGVG